MTRKDNPRQDIIIDIQQEYRRLGLKMDKALQALAELQNPYDSCSEWASLKRAAIDFKKELSKITLYGKSN